MSYIWKRREVAVMARREAEIPGTYVFTGERSQRGYSLNELSMTLT